MSLDVTLQRSRILEDFGCGWLSIVIMINSVSFAGQQGLLHVWLFHSLFRSNRIFTWTVRQGTRNQLVNRLAVKLKITNYYQLFNQRSSTPLINGHYHCYSQPWTSVSSPMIDHHQSFTTISRRQLPLLEGKCFPMLIGDYHIASWAVCLGAHFPVPSAAWWRHSGYQWRWNSTTTKPQKESSIGKSL